MQPPMDLIAKLRLFDPTALHDAIADSNKEVSLSFKHHCPSSVVDAFQVSCANAFRFASHLGDLRSWLNISIHSH